MLYNKQHFEGFKGYEMVSWIERDTLCHTQDIMTRPNGDIVTAKLTVCAVAAGCIVYVGAFIDLFSLFHCFTVVNVPW